MKVSTVVAAVSLLTLAVGLPSSAQAQDVRARALTQQALRYRRHHEDERALELLQEAYRIEPTPHTLAQMALAEQAVGRWAEAERHLVDALRSNDEDSWMAMHRRQLQRQVPVIRGHLGRVFIEGAPSGAEVFVGDRRVAVLPQAEPIRLPLGSAELVIRAAGYNPVTRTVFLRQELECRETIEMTRPGARGGGSGGGATATSNVNVNNVLNNSINIGVSVPTTRPAPAGQAPTAPQPPAPPPPTPSANIAPQPTPNGGGGGGGDGASASSGVNVSNNLNNVVNATVNATVIAPPESVSTEASSPELDPGPAATASRRRARLRAGGVASLVLGGASLAAGVVGLVMRDGAIVDFGNSGCWLNNGVPTAASSGQSGACSDLYSSGNTMFGVGIGGLAGAAVGVGVGTTLLVLSRTPADTPVAFLGCDRGPGDVGIACAGRF